MKGRASKIKWCMLAMLLAFLGVSFGCATPDGENLSERPWNAPKRWEHGLPPSMMDGR
jgi:hypothetical protein